MISQAALEIYIKSGMFDRHKHKIKTSYYNRSKKLAAVVEGVQNENPHLFTSRTVDPIGIHTCLQLKKI